MQILLKLFHPKFLLKILKSIIFATGLWFLCTIAYSTFFPAKITEIDTLTDKIEASPNLVSRDVVAYRKTLLSKREKRNKKYNNKSEILICGALCLHALASGEVKTFLIDIHKGHHGKLNPNKRVTSFRLVRGENCGGQHHPYTKMFFPKVIPNRKYPYDESDIEITMQSLATKGVCLERGTAKLGQADMIITKTHMRGHKKTYVSVHIRADKGHFKKEYLQPNCIRNRPSTRCSKPVILGRSIMAPPKAHQKQEAIHIIRNLLNEKRPANVGEYKIMSQYFGTPGARYEKRFLPPFNDGDFALYIQVLENKQLPYIHSDLQSPALRKRTDPAIYNRYANALFARRTKAFGIPTPLQDLNSSHMKDRQRNGLRPSISTFYKLPDYILDDRFTDVREMVQTHHQSDFVPMLARYGGKSVPVILDIMETAYKRPPDRHRKSFVVGGQKALCRLGKKAEFAKERLKKFEEDHPSRRNAYFKMEHFIALNVEKEWLWKRWKLTLPDSDRETFETSYKREKANISLSCGHGH